MIDMVSLWLKHTVQVRRMKGSVEHIKEAIAAVLCRFHNQDTSTRRSLLGDASSSAGHYSDHIIAISRQSLGLNMIGAASVIANRTRS
jgi:hypothetical protein